MAGPWVLPVGFNGGFGLVPGERLEVLPLLTETSEIRRNNTSEVTRLNNGVAFCEFKTVKIIVESTECFE